jgi:purine-binding chemotaxis protein CheW
MEQKMSEELRDDLYLTFSIGDEVYGIGVNSVREIIGIQPIAVVPEFPEHIKGVINLRGKIIPVMDVRLRFKKPEQPYEARTCIIVVDISGAPMGLIVDEVAEVVTIPESEVAAPPRISRREVGYVRGFGKAEGGIKRLLDIEAFLNEDASVLKQMKEK